MTTTQHYNDQATTSNPLTKILLNLAGPITIYLRLALGIAFLSAVADRFGLLGPPGATNVSWGNFANFLAYTATLTPFVPSFLTPLVGWVSTAAEIVLGVTLIIGFRLRESALLSGLLLLGFAFGITVGTGFKRALDFSVFAAAGGAFLLSVYATSPLSIDAWLRSLHPLTPVVQDERITA